MQETDRPVLNFQWKRNVFLDTSINILSSSNEENKKWLFCWKVCYFILQSDRKKCYPMIMLSIQKNSYDYLGFSAW
jgi:hypothetical protein